MQQNDLQSRLLIQTPSDRVRSTFYKMPWTQAFFCWFFLGCLAAKKNSSLSCQSDKYLCLGHSLRWRSCPTELKNSLWQTNPSRLPHNVCLLAALSDGLTLPSAQQHGTFSRFEKQIYPDNAQTHQSLFRTYCSNNSNISTPTSDSTRIYNIYELDTYKGQI